MSILYKLNEIISQKKFIHLPNELGAWTDPQNEKIKDYIWEADYISKVYKKETLTVNVHSGRTGLSSNIKFVGSHELSGLDGLDPMNMIDILVDARQYIKEKEDLVKGLQKFHRKYKGDINKNKFNKLVDTFLDMSYERKSLYKMMQDMVVRQKKLPKMQYPIVASVKDNTILFDHSLYYFTLELFDVDFYNNSASEYFEKSVRHGCGSSSRYKYPLTVINIDQPYSLDEDGKNPFPVEKAREQEL